MKLKLRDRLRIGLEKTVRPFGTVSLETISRIAKEYGLQKVGLHITGNSIVAVGLGDESYMFHPSIYFLVAVVGGNSFTIHSTHITSYKPESDNPLSALTDEAPLREAITYYRLARRRFTRAGLELVIPKKDEELS